MKIEDCDPTINPPLEDLLEKDPKEVPWSLMGNVAKIMSWAFVPLICPVYGIILMFGLTLLQFTDPTARLLITLVVFGICALLPMILVFILHLFGLVSDVGLNKRNERFIPYTITMICMLLAALCVHRYGAPTWCSMFFVGGAAAGLVNLVVNFWWKISAHAAGVAGLVALLVRIPAVGMTHDNVMLWLLIAIFVSGFLGTCRVYQKRHTPLQVFAGYAVGYAGVYLCMLWG